MNYRVLMREPERYDTEDYDPMPEHDEHDGGQIADKPLVHTD